MKKITIILFIISAGAIGLYFILNSTETNSQTKVDNVPKNTVEDKFIISTQSNSNKIIIDKVIMEKPGFIVIRQVINNQPGQIVEVSDILKEGLHNKVVINLNERQNNDTSPNSKLSSLDNLIAIVYEDNGDKGFNPLLDNVTYINGKILAKYVKTGKIVPEAIAIPNIKTKSEGPIMATITYTNEGFSPNIIKILKGDTVKFINKSNKPMWVASNVHPAHSILPTFDQFGTASFNESYQYTFNKPGEWQYHDHINASRIGMIIVR